MKNVLMVALSLLIVGGSFVSCKKNRPAKKSSTSETALKDSLAQVARADSIAKAEEAARQAELEAERLRLAAEEAEKKRIVYDENGSYSVQLTSWRSETHAEEEVAKWKERGFEHAYVEQFGESETGDVWFRVRIGKFSSREMGMKLANQLYEEYNVVATWVASNS